MTITSAVINQKGGTGKTTTSINTSCALALEGYKVLLIDLDPQAHSTIGLGVELGSYRHAVHDVLTKKRDMSEVILRTSFKNLDLAPSHLHLDKAEQQLTPEMFKESRLYKAIRGLDYEFIMIDCRPTLGTLTINALYASGFIIVPCEISRYSLDGFSDLMETIDNVKSDGIRQKSDFVRILLTKFDARKSVTNDWVTEQLEPYRDLIFTTKIRQNEALNQAHIAMEPIFTFKPNSTGAEDYRKVTKEFLELCRQSEKN